MGGELPGSEVIDGKQDREGGWAGLTLTPDGPYYSKGPTILRLEGREGRAGSSQPNRFYVPEDKAPIRGQGTPLLKTNRLHTPGGDPIE